ncbi:MAG: hypothetical protein JNJ83_19325 [Verrucomicrobiaceae bacterium]|nr:hypothetical protein [Verrucomicrobiaceae bacterium]
MTIQLDWFGCDPHPTWENSIHNILEAIQRMKRVSHASVRVKCLREASPPFCISIFLAISGPDLEISGSGQTFDEALLKASGRVKRALADRGRKVRRSTSAARGVKASFRG